MLYFIRLITPSFLLFRYICTMKITKIHIGQAIKKLVSEKYSSYASFARNIGKSRQCVQTQIFSKPSLQTELLILISEELEVNLFEYYQDEEKNVKQKSNSTKITFTVHFDTTQEELEENGIYEKLKEMVQKKISD